MSDLEQYKRKGYLQKEGALFTLKKRYFVLSPSECKLYWAADASAERALGAIDLAGTSVDVYTTSNKSRRFAFRIRQSGQVVATLVAPDAVARDDWMMAISAVVHSASIAQVDSPKLAASSTHFDVVDSDIDSDSDAHPDIDNNFNSHASLARSVPIDASDELDHRRDRRRRSFDESTDTKPSSSSSSHASRKSSTKPNSPSSSRSAAAASSSRSRPRPQSVSFSTAQLQSALSKSRELAADEFAPVHTPPSMSTSSSSSTKWSAKRMSLPFAGRRRSSGDDTHNDHDMKSADGADPTTHDDTTTAAPTTVAPTPDSSSLPRARSSKSSKSSKSKAKSATMRSPSTVSAADHTDGMLDVLTPRVEVKRASASSSLSSSPAGALTPAPTTPAPKPAPPVSSLSLSSIETPRPSGVAPAPPTGNRRRALTAVNGEPAPNPSTKSSKDSASSTMDPRSLRIALAKKELLEEIAEERAAAAGAAQPTTSQPPTTVASPAALRALSVSPTPLAPPHSASPSRGMLESGSSRKVISPTNSGHIGAGSGNANRGLRNSPIPVANAQEELVLTPREKARREKSLDIQKRMFQAVVSESKGRKLLTDEGKVIFDPSDDDSQQSPAPPRRAAPRSGERRRSSSFSASPVTTSWPTVNLDESPRTPKGSAPPAETMTIDGAGSDSDESEVDFTAPSKPSPAAISAASGVAINQSDDGSDALDEQYDNDDDDAPLPPPTSAPIDSPRARSPMKKPPPPSAPLIVPKPPATPPMAPRASLSGSGVPPPLPATPEQPRRSLSTSGKVSSLVARFSSSNSEPKRASPTAAATAAAAAASAAAASAAASAAATVPPPPPGPPPSD